MIKALPLCLFLLAGPVFSISPVNSFRTGVPPLNRSMGDASEADTFQWVGLVPLKDGIPHTGWIKVNHEAVEGELEKVKALTFYQRGVPGGPSYTWHPNGKIKAVGQFVEGVPTGAFWTAHDNGEIASRSFYRGGLLHGEATAYYRNGALYLESRFEGGKPVSQSFWSKTGSPIFPGHSEAH